MAFVLNHRAQCYLTLRKHPLKTVNKLTQGDGGWDIMLDFIKIRCAVTGKDSTSGW